MIRHVIILEDKKLFTKMLYKYCINSVKFKGIYQGSKGKRQWPMNLCTSPMMIHKITPSVDYSC